MQEMKFKRLQAAKQTEVADATHDDLISVVRRLGGDESKERYEAKLKKIAAARA